MSKDKQHIDLIQRYLDDDLTSEERVDFEQLLVTDKDLNDAFLDMQQLEADISQSLSRKHLKELIAANLDRNLEVDDYTPGRGIAPAASRIPPAASKRFFMKPVYAIAASIALIAVVSLVLWTNKSDSPPDLVYEPFIGLDSTSTLAKGRMTLSELEFQRDSLNAQIVVLDSALIAGSEKGYGPHLVDLEREIQATKSKLLIVTELIAIKDTLELIEINTDSTSIDPSVLDNY